MARRKTGCKSTMLHAATCLLSMGLFSGEHTTSLTARYEKFVAVFGTCMSSPLAPQCGNAFSLPSGIYDFRLALKNGHVWTKWRFGIEHSICSSPFCCCPSPRQLLPVITALHHCLAFHICPLFVGCASGCARSLHPCVQLQPHPRLC